MHVNLKNKDFWSGVMLLSIGLAAGGIACGSGMMSVLRAWASGQAAGPLVCSYPMGTVLRMGSGYFPMLLSAILCGFGVALIVRALATTETIDWTWLPREWAAFLLAMALFVVVFHYVGMGPALIAAGLCSVFAGNARAIILLPVAFALFGYLLDRAGFVPAMLVLVFGSAAAGREFHMLEVIALAVFMTLLSIGIFIYGLGLPYQMLVWPPNLGLGH